MHTTIYPTKSGRGALIVVHHSAAELQLRQTLRRARAAQALQQAATWTTSVRQLPRRATPS